MTFQGVFNYYPVCIAGEESVKKVDGSFVKTGLYDVTVLALDNDLIRNKNNLFVSGGKSANVSVNFKIKKEFVPYLKFLEPVKCVAELTPTNFDFLIKIVKIEISGKFVDVVADEVQE